MEKNSIEAIVRSLNEHAVQYMIVGGLAVVAHGYLRLTVDVDLLLAVDPDNLKRMVTALEALGYRPRAPVAFSEFVDAENRRKWMTEKGATVFALDSPAHPTAEIDLFMESPIDFTQAYTKAVRYEVAPGVVATVCGIDDLIAMKTVAGRPRDLDDIDRLRRLDRGGRHE